LRWDKKLADGRSQIEANFNIWSTGLTVIMSDKAPGAKNIGHNSDQQKMLTVRQKITQALEGESLDLREISKGFGIKENEVLDHLKHIAKSVHPRRLTAEPAFCKQCGFSFKKRTRLNTPGRCPICKSEHISPPRFKINHSL
jgi:predicted Zn-ribbon and HTH transcriptional regulator